MTTQHKAILASAVVALLGAGSAYAQDTQNSQNTQQTPAPHSEGAAEARTQAKPKSQAARAVESAKPKGYSLTVAERSLLQQRLRDDGVYHGPVDGKVNDATTRAIAAYQRKHGLVATGRPNNATLSSLGIMASRAEPAAPRTAQASAEPAARTPDDELLRRQPMAEGQSEVVDLTKLSVAETRALQEKLQRLGFYEGEIDGRAGASTQRALREYYLSEASPGHRGQTQTRQASTQRPNQEIERVRGEEQPAKQQPAKQPAKKAPKTDARTMERGLDNTPQDTDTGTRP